MGGEKEGMLHKGPGFEARTTPPTKTLPNDEAFAATAYFHKLSRCNRTFPASGLSVAGRRRGKRDQSTGRDGGQSYPRPYGEGRLRGFDRRRKKIGKTSSSGIGSERGITSASR